jgi:hypothetical protein
MKKNIIVCMSLLFLFWGCKKDTYQTPIYTKQDLPVSVGSYWVYHHHFYTNNMPTDTLKMVSVQSEKGLGDTTKLYFTLYRKTDSVASYIGYYTNAGFTLKDNNPQYSYFGDFHIDFPFKVGDGWKSTSDTDVLKVGSYTEEYLDGSINYNKIFHLLSYHNYKNKITANELYVAKGIGVVYRGILEDDGNGHPRKESYLLIDYHIQ